MSTRELVVDNWIC